MGNRTAEKEIFTRFIQEAPLFADATVKKWDVATSDPPDIKCELDNGREVGVELTSWLDALSSTHFAFTQENRIVKTFRVL
jgi:hypothetical protein